MGKILPFLFLMLSTPCFSQHHTEYHNNGIKLSKITYVDGKFHGEVRFWYRNGNIQTIGKYDHGIPVGKHTEWYESRYLKSIIYYDTKGKPLSYTEWNEDQQKVVLGKFTGGKKDNVWNYYNNQGKLIKEEIYRRGSLLETKVY